MSSLHYQPSGTAGFYSGKQKIRKREGQVFVSFLLLEGQQDNIFSRKTDSGICLKFSPVLSSAPVSNLSFCPRCSLKHTTGNHETCLVCQRHQGRECSGLITAAHLRTLHSRKK